MSTGRDNSIALEIGRAAGRQWHWASGRADEIIAYARPSRWPARRAGLMMGGWLGPAERQPIGVLALWLAARPPGRRSAQSIHGGRMPVLVGAPLLFVCTRQALFSLEPAGRPLFVLEPGSGRTSYRARDLAAPSIILMRDAPARRPAGRPLNQPAAETSQLMKFDARLSFVRSRARSRSRE